MCKECGSEFYITFFYVDSLLVFIIGRVLLVYGGEEVFRR